MDDIVDLVALGDVRNHLDREVLGVLEHVHDDLLYRDRNRTLELHQELLFIVDLAERELESIGLQYVEVPCFTQLLHDLLLLSNILCSHLSTSRASPSSEIPCASASRAPRYHCTCLIELEWAGIQSIGVKELCFPVGEIQIHLILFLAVDVSLESLHILILSLLHPLIVLLY